MKPKTIKIPPRLGIKVSYLAEQLECSTDVLIANIKRSPDHRLYLRGFKISTFEYRVNWEDAIDFINRNYVTPNIIVD